MSQQIQNLIDKIKNDGIKAADQQAKDIENHSKQQAQLIISDAKKQAEKILQDAKYEIKKKEDSSRMALKQASRDTILSLRKGINEMLNKIVKESVSGALSSEELINIISFVAHKAIEADQVRGNIVISLNAADQEKFKNDIISRLQKGVTSGIEVKRADDIGKGFSISFDSGKSSFEFTDDSLAEYLSGLLNEELASIVKGSV